MLKTLPMQLLAKYTDNKSVYQKSPKSAKKNLNKLGYRKPMTHDQCVVLYDKDLNINSFQRTASTYYKTNKLGALLTLANENNNHSIVIDFTKQKLSYLKIKVYRRNTHVLDFEIPYPQFNSDLFKKILNHKLL